MSYDNLPKPFQLIYTQYETMCLIDLVYNVRYEFSVIFSQSRFYL